MKEEKLYKLQTLSVYYNNMINIYSELADLEINGGIYSSEYYEKVKDLQLYNSAISVIRRRLDLEADEIFDFEENLAFMNHIDNLDFVIDTLELNGVSKAKKLCMFLYDYSRENHLVSIEKEDIANVIKFDMNNGDDEDEIEEIDAEIDYSYLIMNDELTLFRDKIFSSTLMDYLLLEIDNCDDLYIKNKLIQIKYQLIFLLSDLEQSFIRNPKQFTRTSYYQDLMLEKYIHYDCFREDYTDLNLNNISTELDYICEIDVNLLDNIDNYIRVLLRKLYIKTCISINCDENVRLFLETVKKKINKSIKNSTIKKNFNDCFNTNKSLSLRVSIDFNELS